VQDSAKGWHTAQVAILGLLGVVGVSRGEAALAALPDPVKYLVLSAVIVAFAAASTGATLIARVAWPLWREQAALDVNDDLAVRESVLRGQRRLRRAVTATVVALVAMGLAFALSWWPADSQKTTNNLRVRSGAETVCGELVTSSGTKLIIKVSGQEIAIPMSSVTTLEPVSSCS
jgi:hypothetical protein